MIAECGSSKMQSQDIWAYDFTNYEWYFIPMNRFRLYNDSNFYQILEPNQATLCFLEARENELGHYVVVYRKDNSIMIRDPQSDFNGFINKYIWCMEVSKSKVKIININ